jgi:hypothetical protein
MKLRRQKRRKHLTTQYIGFRSVFNKKSSKPYLPEKEDDFELTEFRQSFSHRAELVE